MNSKPNSDHPDIVAWPPLIFLGFAVGGTLAHFLFPVRIVRYPVSLLIGVVLSTGAAALAIWAVLAMKAAGTNFHPSHPALAVVKAGPYRFTRNPMYLSLCLLQIGIAFFLDGWLPVAFAVLLGLALHFGVVLREEVYLERKFGDQYLALKRQVRRWI